ncbi:MAG: Spx/MgsR family RNA polymerase-binding regulatory protein [Litorimonas sp.]
MKIYHLKTCDTCRKAIKALRNSGHELELIDVRSDGVPAAQLAKIEQAVGYEKLLNTRSTTWRGLDASQKQNIDASKALALISEHPTLMKRPVIIKGDQITLGWTKETQNIWL